MSVLKHSISNITNIRQDPSPSSQELNRENSSQTISHSRATEGTILAERYLIQLQLGRGGFGITYLAQNIYLPGEPLCIIKKFFPRFKNQAYIKAAELRFYLEAKSLSKLASHAGIPALLDYFQIGTDIYLVEEYIPGRNLAQIVSQQRKFTTAEVEKFLFQMLYLLKYIHGHYLIHRDIKPQNVILSQTDRRFVLIDFGAVKDLQPLNQEQQDRSIVSQAIGTPGFAPPEQLAQRPVYASDIYALGMTCIYLLVGKEPSQLPTDPISCELIWIDELEIDLDLSELISKMIQISLPDRYHSADQVLTALNRRAARIKLRATIDQEYAITPTKKTNPKIDYPSVVHWALKLLDEQI